MAGKRIGHRKSRKGCLRCKARRVKCDERSPCSACVRHNETCSLTQGMLETSEATSPSKIEAVPPRGSVSPDSPATHSGIHLAVPRNSDLVQGSYYSPEWMQSLKLLHHYSTTVYATLVRDPSTTELWKVTVPQIACAHEFFMHGLLAVSALHYAHTHPTHHREFAIISSAYQNLALQHFSSNLGDINEENCEAFFLLASFIVVVSICSVANPYDPEKNVTSRDVVQAFYLSQGVRNILAFKPIEKWSKDGPLAPLLVPLESSVPRKSLNFQRRMEKIADLARTLPLGMVVINERSGSLLAIEALRSAYLETGDEFSPLSARRVWLWAFSLPPLFLEMICNDHPIALIILAHFAALAKPFGHQDWITRGWSLSVITLVDHLLVDPWIEWIEWPRQCVAGGKNVDDLDP
ncbi:hypothetical protein BHE90_005331 [Fusarium euwallaceae]|uniref:Zn(2)-C6 fungal-type domain-containing protein n=1 Tax=Fusarium euwallaceae TaxID=1147111 RepID=A0A430LWP1_9HYPO|nr:hypothetical protein BHE90_005331 [Fusarium euwallaceae]